LAPRYTGHYSLAKGANCEFLIHSHTTDGSTTFLDYSVNGYTVSVGAADVEHDTDQKKFGTSSILFDGDSGFLSLSDQAVYDLDTNDFTIEFRIRINVFPVSNVDVVLSQVDDYNNGWAVIISSSTHQILFRHKDQSGGGLYVDTSAGAGGEGTNFTGESPILKLNTWHHVVFERSGNNFYVFLDGKLKRSGTVVGLDVDNVSGDLEIGRGPYIHGSAAIYYVDGWLEEIRIVNGDAMFSADMMFWPPTKFYE